MHHHETNQSSSAKMPSLFKVFRRRTDQPDSVQSAKSYMHSPSNTSTTSNASAYSLSPSVSSSSSHRHQYSIRVALLDGRVIQLNYTKNDDANQLFGRVCDEEQIGVEKDWFGLRFIDLHGQPHWLDLHKNARSQLKKGLPHGLHYRNSLMEDGSGSTTTVVNAVDSELKVSPSKTSIASNSSYVSSTLPRRSGASSPASNHDSYGGPLPTLNESFDFTGGGSAGGGGGGNMLNDVSELQFRFKFYPQHPLQALQEEATRYALVKQLRSDFQHGKLTGSVTDESKFIAHLLQADFGSLADHQERLAAAEAASANINNSLATRSDFERATTPPMPSSNSTTTDAAAAASSDAGSSSPTMPVSANHNHSTTHSPIPDAYREMNHFGNAGEEKILNAWAACGEATPPECDEMLLHSASQLESYGIAEPAAVHDQQNNRDATLGCNYAGIFIRNSTRRVNAFAWSKVQKVGLDGKLIVVHALDADSTNSSAAVGAAATSNGSVVPATTKSGGDEINKFVYKCKSASSAKALWKFILENKIFYSAVSSKGIAPVRSGRIGPLSFHRRVTLRFSGRTAREAVEQGEHAQRQRRQVLQNESSVGGGGGSSVSATSSPAPPLVHRTPLVATYTLPDTLTAAARTGGAGSTSGATDSAAAGGGRAVVPAADDEKWKHTKHDLMSQLHDRQLKHSLEVMQAQTYCIAEDLQDIRSPNSVGSEANKRARFPLLTPGGVGGESGDIFFQTQSQMHNASNNYDAELEQIQQTTNSNRDGGVRFCTVGDTPMTMMGSSSSSGRTNPVVVLRDGKWVDADTGAPFNDHPGAGGGGGGISAATGRLKILSDADDEGSAVYRRRNVNSAAAASAAADNNNNTTVTGTGSNAPVNSFYAERERINASINKNITSGRKHWFALRKNGHYSHARVRLAFIVMSLVALLLSLIVVSLLLFETSLLDPVLRATGIAKTIALARRHSYDAMNHHHHQNNYQYEQLDAADANYNGAATVDVSKRHSSYGTMLEQWFLNYKRHVYDRTYDFVYRFMGKRAI